MKIPCANTGELLEIGLKCQNKLCIHNNQDVNTGCLQQMVGRKSQPIDMQHFFRHDRKKKAALFRVANERIVCAGKIFRKVEEASYLERDLEKALERAWLIYPQQHKLLGELPRVTRLLPSFMSFIRQVFWIDIIRRNIDDMESSGWLTPHVTKEITSTFSLLQETPHSSRR